MIDNYLLELNLAPLVKQFEQQSREGRDADATDTLVEIGQVMVETLKRNVGKCYVQYWHPDEHAWLNVGADGYGTSGIYFPVDASEAYIVAARSNRINNDDYRIMEVGMFQDRELPWDNQAWFEAIRCVAANEPDLD